MQVLCDTHALLWAIRQPTRLSARARALMENPRVSLLASSVSAFEVATKHRLGKLPEADLLIHEYGRLIARLGARPLPLQDAHALWAGALPWEHRDPFDRLIAAQSMVEHAPLITADPAFADLGGLETIW